MEAFADFAELLGPTPSPQAKVVAESLPIVSAVAMGSGVYGSGAFEGANRFDQLRLWAPAMQSADMELLPDKDRLDARTLDLLKNDSFVAGASATHKDSIVGAVYLLNAKPMTKILWGKEDEVWEREFQEEVETKFTLLAESPKCWLDAKRTKTLTDMVRLAVGVDMAGGEVLMTSEWMPDDGRPYRTAGQMVDTARLCDPMSGRMWLDRKKMRGGVEVDARGAPVAYHIRMGHPGDYFDSGSYLWRRVMAYKPWGRPNVLHQFEELRAEQSRGIASMVSALQDIKMLKGFRKTEIQQAVTASSYGTSIESELPTEAVFRALGGNDTAENPAMAWIQEYLSAISEYSGGANNLVIDGQKIPVLMPGTKLNLQNTGVSSPDAASFEQRRLRYIAAALGVSYEQLSKDYSQTSYASGRLSRGDTQLGQASRKKRVADRTANFLYSNWLEEAVNNNDLECLKRRNVPKFYEGLNAEAYVNCEWIGAGATLIEALKETQAYVLQLKNGLNTKERVMARLHGSDWRQDSRQIAREMQNDEDLKIPSVFTIDSTDAENALSGTPQERES